MMSVDVTRVGSRWQAVCLACRAWRAETSDPLTANRAAETHAVDCEVHRCRG